MFRTDTQTKKHSTCPIGRVAHIIGDTNALLIIRDLFAGAKCFGEIETSLAGVSTRTITKKLRLLEEQGIIERNVVSKKPPRVEYSLTKKGQGLSPIEKAMRVYGEKYL